MQNAPREYRKTHYMTEMKIHMFILHVLTELVERRLFPELY